MAANFQAADRYQTLVLKRTGLKPSELVCPREKSEMTPCLARDGHLAVADGGSLGVCTGCDQYLKPLLEKEEAKHRPAKPEDPMTPTRDQTVPPPDDMDRMLADARQAQASPSPGEGEAKRYRSVAELAAEHSNLQDYLSQLEQVQKIILAENARLRAELSIWKPLTSAEAEKAFNEAEAIPLSEDRIREIVRKATDPATRIANDEQAQLAAENKRLRAELARRDAKPAQDDACKECGGAGGWVHRYGPGEEDGEAEVCDFCEGTGRRDTGGEKPLTLAEVVEKARGGPAPIPFQGFA